MKKHLTILLSLLFITSEANARDGFYIGLDGLLVHAQHKLTGQSQDYTNTYTVDSTLKKVGGDSVGFGLNAGYKFGYEKFYIAPEAFFEQLNNKVNYDKLDGRPYIQDYIVLNYRYGVKANLGYNINRDFAAFITYGAAMVDYDVRWAKGRIYPQKQYGDQAISQTYGLGLLYNINDNWSTKLGYDRQTANVRYIYRGLNSRARIEIAKVGVIYNF